MRYRVSNPIEPDELSEIRGLPATLPNGVEVGIVESGTGTGLDVYAETTVEPASPLPSLTAPDGVLTFSIPAVEERGRLSEALHYMAAFGGFLLGVSRVDWSKTKEQWIPETPEEEGASNVFSFTRKEDDSPPWPRMLASLNWDSLLRNYTPWRPITIPMTFLIEGREAYGTRRYYESFVFSYLYLEGMYAGGKTATRQVIRQFRGARPLTLAATQAVENIARKRGDGHDAQFKGLCREFGCDPTGGGLLELMVKLRGALFHSQPRSSKRTADLTVRREYHTPAYLAMSLSMLTATLELPDCGILPEVFGAGSGAEGQPGE